MPALDELSRAIGRIEGTIKAIGEEQKKQGKKISIVHTTLTNHRIKVAGIASGSSLGIYAVIEYLKTKFGAH